MKKLLLTLVVIALIAAWLWTPDIDRGALESRYAQPPSEFVRVLGLRVHVRDTGPRDAPAIILLHGLGASLHTWQDWASGLDGDFRVIRYDLPGAGLTGADPHGDYSDERSMQVLAALMDALDVGSATLVGHSMGGRLAWRFAASETRRVDGLVLVAPDGFASPGFEYGKAPKVPLSMRLMPYVLPKPLLLMALKPAYADPSAIGEAVRTRYYELMLAPGVRRAMIDRLRQSVLRNPVPMLRQITAPTLLLWGEGDAMIPVTNADDYRAAMPHALLVILPDVGHVPQEERPSESLASVRAFLDGRLD